MRSSRFTTVFCDDIRWMYANNKYKDILRWYIHEQARHHRRARRST